VATSWKDDWPLSDPKISPILADLELLNQANIKVDGVIAGHDVLGPDAVFRKELGEW
jgi:hypothetical protein